MTTVPWSPPAHMLSLAAELQRILGELHPEHRFIVTVKDPTEQLEARLSMLERQWRAYSQRWKAGP